MRKEFREKFLNNRDFPKGGLYVIGSFFLLNVKKLLLKDLIDPDNHIYIISKEFPTFTILEYKSILTGEPLIELINKPEGNKSPLIHIVDDIESLYQINQEKGVIVVDDYRSFVENEMRKYGGIAENTEVKNSANRNLKTLALENQVPVFVISTHKKYLYSDGIIGFRENLGSNIEQIADMIMYLTFPDGVLRNPEQVFTSLSRQMIDYLDGNKEKEFDLLVLKNRFGPVGSMRVRLKCQR